MKDYGCTKQRSPTNYGSAKYNSDHPHTRSHARSDAAEASLSSQPQTTSTGATPVSPMSQGPGATRPAGRRGGRKH